MDWKQRAVDARLPPASEEWTLCEFSAMLCKVLTVTEDPAVVEFVRQYALPLVDLRVMETIGPATTVPLRGGASAATALQDVPTIRAPATPSAALRKKPPRTNVASSLRTSVAVAAATSAAEQPRVRVPAPELPSWLTQLLQQPTIQSVFQQYQIAERYQQLYAWYQTVRERVGDRIPTWLPPLLGHQPPSPVSPAEVSFPGMTSGPVKVLAWHRHLPWFAVAHQQDVLFLYNLQEQEWLLPTYLKNDKQKEIKAMAWQPMTMDTLAVACKEGILLWTIQRAERAEPPTSSTNVGAAAPGSAADAAAPSAAVKPTIKHRLFSHPSLRNASCVAWSPDGRYLVCGNSRNGSLGVWDFSNLSMQPQQPTVLRKMGSETLELAFSPDGHYLLVSQTTTRGHGRLRILETLGWSDVAVEYNQCCRNVQWLADGRALLFNLEGGRDIHAIRLTRPFPSLDYAFERAEVIPEKTHEISGEIIKCGGVIHKMALSPSGTRLVVSFRPDKTNAYRGAEYLMVFNVKAFGPSALTRVQYMTMGYIHGPMPMNAQEWKEAEEHQVFASLLSFSYAYEKGALLATCWEDGRIRFTPFLFTPESFDVMDATTHKRQLRKW